jgi:ribosomal protein S18 acetylase RimI-like enzyme
MSDSAERENPEVEIQLATADDAPSISAVLLQAFIEYESLYTAGGFAATTPDVEQIQRRLIEGPVWIALRDGSMIGTVSAVLQGGSVYIRGMAVLPAARGFRVGELLMTQIERFAAANKCRRLYLSTTPFLARAIALYRRLGFCHTDEGPHDLHGTPLLTMERMFEPAS